MQAQVDKLRKISTELLTEYRLLSLKVDNSGGGEAEVVQLDEAMVLVEGAVARLRGSQLNELEQGALTRLQETNLQEIKSLIDIELLLLGQKLEVALKPMLKE
tara:strand:+ start:498 stop:806 length:309 start_codon:yes stop_codon:yes gene_type:complete